MNITLKELRFSNMFSYGADNCIRLDEHRINQLTATNGSGKSSIALILQELLFSKNVKSIKKTDILNRYIKDKSWNGELDFSVDDKEYTISVRRQGASTKVKLLENGVDISEHKVLDTYKRIQEILGLDFSVFSQLTYQSSVDLLDFLKATDTNRKKFLINLFNLEKYLEIGEVVKLAHKECDKEVTALNTELKTIESFLNSTNIPDKQYEIEVPEVDDQLSVEISKIKTQLDNYSDICKRIDKNNMYIKERDSLSFDVSVKEPEQFAHMEQYQALKIDIGVLNTSISDIEKRIKGLKLIDKCPSCGQAIDNSHQVSMKSELEAKLEKLQKDKERGLKQARIWSEEVKQWEEDKKKYTENKRAVERFEQLTQVIDTAMDTEYPNVGNLSSKLKELEAELVGQKKKANDAINHNKQVSAHNSKVEALIEQKSEFTSRQDAINTDIVEKADRLANLNVLKKAFSPSGIVAFKLENLTKELELSINYYLSLLSDGQFQVEFLLDKEKLNISVINNGETAPIETASGGEFSRIQTAVLLAIRSLLSKLGGSSINLLFLDEVTGVLDEDGKESLINVLQEEENLNVFLISHDFSHPLVNKTIIKKENNISTVLG